MQLAKNKNNEIVRISHIPITEDCFCIDCGKLLDARNKKIHDRKREFYFAHKNGKLCTGTEETYLHAVAKLIIKEEEQILLPELGMVKYDNVELEKTIHDIKADALIVDMNGKEIIIEIYVTHETEEEKIIKIRERGIIAFEIDLSKLNYNSKYEEIKIEVIENRSNRKNLFDIENACEEIVLSKKIQPIIVNIPTPQPRKVEKNNNIGVLFWRTMLIAFIAFIGYKLWQLIMSKKKISY